MPDTVVTPAVREGRPGPRPFLDDPVKVSFMLPRSVHERLETYCKRKRISLSEGARLVFDAFPFEDETKAGESE